MDLHMIQFDGLSFGMDVQDKAAFKVMKRHVFYRSVMTKDWGCPKRVPCVKAEELAAIMGEAGWLVSEGRYMKTVRWGDGIDHYVIYDDND